MQRKPLASDHRPGSLPDIATDDDGVTYVMQLAQLAPDMRLRLRCDVRGNVWVSIDADSRGRHDDD